MMCNSKLNCQLSIKSTSISEHLVHNRSNSQATDHESLIIKKHFILTI